MDKELADHLERVRAARGELTESIRALEDASRSPRAWEILGGAASVRR